MALLEDPTIQRILDEVNKAASGGVFGLAGNYIPDSPDVGKRAPPAKHQGFHHHHHQSQQHPPMFYPTADMFGLDDLRNFHPNSDMQSMEPIVPVAAPNNFDLYSAGLYNTMPQNMMSPYENYKTDTVHNHKHLHAARPISTVSSTNNDILLEHHRHLEYPTIPPKITAAVPNLGLNLRVATPQVDTIRMQLADTDDGEFLSAPMPNVPTDTATASIDLVADKDDSSSLPINENEEIDGSNLCDYASLPSDHPSSSSSSSLRWPHLLRSQSADHSTQRFEFRDVQTEHHCSLSPTTTHTECGSAGHQRGQLGVHRSLHHRSFLFLDQLSAATSVATSGDQA